MNPEVSVIIPAWNAAAYIGDSIASALSQRNVSTEVLVVDDHSSDDTVHAVRRWRDPRVRLFRMDARRGPSAARNLAIANARGRWLAVLDADDEFLPGRLRKLIALAQRQHAPLVVDNLLFNRGTDSPRTAMFPRHRPAAAYRSLEAAEWVDGNHLMGARYNLGYLKPLILKEFVDQNRLRYDERVPVGEDYLFLLEAMLRGGACLFDEDPGYLYRVHDASLTAQRLDRDRIRAMIEGDRRLMQRCPVPAALLPALRRRHRSLLDAEAYTLMADDLRQGHWSRLLRTVNRRPLSARHFARPLRERLHQWFGARWQRTEPLPAPNLPQGTG